MPSRRLLALLATAAFAAATASVAALGGPPSNPRRTVLAWIEGNMTDVADFVLRGSGRGAVNAVSHISMFRILPNGTLFVDEAAVAEHRATWQEGAAKEQGIRTHPCLGVGSIETVRALFKPAAQGAFVAALARAVHETDVDGINIDFEPPNPTHANGSLDPSSPEAPTFEDGLAFAKFLDALGKALHAVPGRRRILTMDSESVAGACWALGPGPPYNHTWDLRPCPWIRRFWNLDAVADTELDVVIPMDTYTRNSTEFPYDLWLYQKYFTVDRIGWGLYPTQDWGPNQTAASQAFVDSRMDAFEAYDSSWISCWVINPGTKETPTREALEVKWAPWIPRFRKFLGQGGKSG